MRNKVTFQSVAYAKRTQAGKQGIGVNEAHDLRPDGQSSRTNPSSTSSATSTGTAWAAYPATVGNSRQPTSSAKTVTRTRFTVLTAPFGEGLRGDFRRATEGARWHHKRQHSCRASKHKPARNGHGLRRFRGGSSENRAAPESAPTSCRTGDPPALRRDRSDPHRHRRERRHLAPPAPAGLSGARRYRLPQRPPAVRMERAHRLLSRKTHNLTVRATARQVGYRQASGLRQAFMRFYGYNPSAIQPEPPDYDRFWREAESSDVGRATT